MAAEEEDEGEFGDVPEVQKTINKMLDKVCGKKKQDEEEDLATILRKPIDFTKSGRYRRGRSLFEKMINQSID